MVGRLATSALPFEITMTHLDHNLSHIKGVAQVLYESSVLSVCVYVP
jgi:hypothetical protein